MSTNELSALANEEEGISIKMLDKELILLKEMVTTNYVLYATIQND